VDRHRIHIGHELSQSGVAGSWRIEDLYSVADKGSEDFGFPHPIPVDGLGSSFVGLVFHRLNRAEDEQSLEDEEDIWIFHQVFSCHRSHKIWVAS